MAVVVPGFEEHEWAEDELQVLTDRGLTTIATHLVYSHLSPSVLILNYPFRIVSDGLGLL